MPTRDDYRLKALEFRRRANREIEPEVKSMLENLAEAHDRLAETTDRSHRPKVKPSPESDE
jgi:hypothetical protein